MARGVVNLFSDTQTKPTPAMRRAIAAAEVGDEQRREDPTVLELERRVAELLGHEAAAARAEVDREAFDRSRVEMMRGYAEDDGCRRAYILGYFGEPFEPPCGRCDACDAGRGQDGATTGAGTWAVGRRVRHPEWGAGTVQRAEDDTLTVVFDGVGYKTLAVDVVEDRDLLEPADGE